MPLSDSEKYLVTDAFPIQLGNSEIVLQDELGNSNLRDVEEYSCTNRELVNLENAAVNIDNSNDVIIGPVTQFNVSGNVTIYQNGTTPTEAIADKTIIEEQESTLKFTNGAKLTRSEKTESEEQDSRNLNKHKKVVKILLAISLSLIIIIGITVILLFNGNKINGDGGSIPNESSDGDSETLGDHQILDRTKWNGRPALEYKNITAPVPMVVIKHTGGGTCSSFLVCAGKLQTIQSHCVSTGSPDIDYNFLIGGDGNIYVGRGWDVQAQQRDGIIDIAFMGSFTFDPLTPIMIDAAKVLIQCGVDRKKLTEDYKIVCHNQTWATESPGLNVIKEVKTWPHYDPGMYY